MPRSVLIVKLGAIGDVVMALPMVSALREIDPSTRITWLCGASATPLVRCVEGVDEVVTIDEASIVSGTASRRTAAVLAAWRSLGGRRYDLVILAHADPRYRLLTFPIFAGERRNLGPRGTRSGPVPGRYMGDEYVRMVTRVDDGSARRYRAPHVDVALDAGIAERIAGRSLGSLVALAPGGARNSGREDPLRRWPLENYVDLARTLRGQGREVALTGAAGDAWVRPAFDGVDVIDLVGGTSVPGLVALYRRCAAVVTHDSGPLHLAGLAGTRIVALFGPTSPSTMFRAGERASLLWPGVALPCAPCYDGRGFAACSDARCMRSIAPETVAATVAALLAR